MRNRMSFQDEPGRTSGASRRPHPSENVRSAQEPAPEAVRARAFAIFQERKGQNGDCTSDWLRAEKELKEVVRGHEGMIGGLEPRDRPIDQGL